MIKKKLSENYEGMTRFISYWHQIDLIKKQTPKNILEIGIANGTISNYLKNNGFKVTTCDINKDFDPDYVADIKNLPFKDNEFDLVACFEVLEHIPFEDSKKALRELKRVSKNKVIISIPYYGYEINFLFKFKGIQRIFRKEIFDLLIKIPPFFKKFKKTKHHYWEMGYRGYSKRKIKKELNKLFIIEKEVRPKIDTYHYFFILNKNREDGLET